MHSSLSHNSTHKLTNRMHKTPMAHVHGHAHRLNKVTTLRPSGWRHRPKSRRGCGTWSESKAGESAKVESEGGGDRRGKTSRTAGRAGQTSRTRCTKPLSTSKHGPERPELKLMPNCSTLTSIDTARYRTNLCCDQMQWRTWLSMAATRPRPPSPQARAA